MADQEQRASLVIDLSTEDGVRKLEALARAVETVGEEAQDTAGEFEAVERQLEQMNRREAFRQVRDGLRDLAAGAREIAGEFDGRIGQAAELARATATWAEATGATLGEMEALGRVGRGVVGGLFDDVGDVGDLMRELGDRATEAALGNEQYRKTFAALGVEVTNADGSMRDTVELFVEVNDALTRLEDSTLAMTVAGNLMTDVGRSWAANLRERGATLSELLRTESEHNVLTEEGREALERYEAASRRLREAQEKLDVQIATSSAPAVAEFKTRLAELLATLTDANPPLAAFLGLTAKHGGDVLALAGNLGMVASGLTAIGVSAKALMAIAPEIMAVLAAVGLLLEFKRRIDSFNDSIGEWAPNMFGAVFGQPRRETPADLRAYYSSDPGIHQRPSPAGPRMPSADLREYAVAETGGSAEAAAQEAEQEAARALAHLAWQSQRALELGDADEARGRFEEYAAGTLEPLTVGTERTRAAQRLEQQRWQLERQIEQMRAAQERERRQAALTGAREEVEQAGLQLELLGPVDALVGGTEQQKRATEDLERALRGLQSAYREYGGSLSDVLQVELEIKRLRDEQAAQGPGLVEQLVVASGNLGAIEDVIRSHGGRQVWQSPTGAAASDILVGVHGDPAYQQFVRGVAGFVARELVLAVDAVGGGLGP